MRTEWVIVWAVVAVVSLAGVTRANEINFNFAGMLPDGCADCEDCEVCETCEDCDDCVEPLPVCSGGLGQTDEETKESIFNALTVEEMETVAAFVLAADPNMDLERFEVGPFNYITQMDPALPTKAEAVAYLYGDGPKPARYARVTVARGYELDVSIYKVGPLPVSESTTIETIGEPFPFEVRGRDGLEFNSLTPIVEQIFEDIQQIVNESFAGLPFDAPEGPSIKYHATAPPGLLAADRLERCFFVLNVPGTSRQRDLHTLPFEFRINASGSDPSTWYSYDFYYARQGPYATTAELLDAFNNDPEFVKISLSEEHIADYIGWTREFRDVPRRAGSELAKPITVEPEGHRYKITDHTVEWMGWRFHVGSTQLRGPTIKGITFKGERIAYEISMNSLTLAYSCDDPVQGNVMYFDATFGIGETSTPIAGDCPAHSSHVWDTWWSPSSAQAKFSYGICIFEKDMQGVAWRRDDGSQGALRDSHLVVRYPIPVGNYDYVAEYHFGLDGSIQYLYGASGNMQSSWYFMGSDTRDKFSDRIYRHSMGCLHDHNFGWKVDLDIVNESNNFERIIYKAGTPEEVFDGQPPAYLEYPIIRYIERQNVEYEQDAKVSKSISEPDEWIINNPDSLNRWGNPRGYKFVFPLVAADILGPTHPINIGGAYRKYNLAVSVQHDDEESIDDTWSLNRLSEPSFTLDTFFEDNEYLPGADLVQWTTFSVLHYPSAEDAPMQSMLSSGITIKPFNFFDETATFDLPANVVDADGTVLNQEVPNPQCVPAEF